MKNIYTPKKFIWLIFNCGLASTCFQTTRPCLQKVNLTWAWSKTRTCSEINLKNKWAHELTSPSSPTTTRIGSVRISRQSISTFFLNVALNSNATDKIVTKTFMPAIQLRIDHCYARMGMEGKEALVNALQSRASRSGSGSEDTLLSECLSQPGVTDRNWQNTCWGGVGGRVELRRIPFNPEKAKIPPVSPWYRPDITNRW